MDLLTLTEQLPPLQQLPYCFSQLPFSDSTHKNRDDQDLLQIRAGNDFEAVQCWLQRFALSPATFRAYQKEGLRLLLWCYWQQRALGQLDVADLERYMTFLKDPLPRALWCSRQSGGRGTKRGDNGWKPFMTGLSNSGITLSFAVLTSLWNYLVDASYLRKNPLKLMKAPSKFQYQERRYDVIERVPTPVEWQALLVTINAMENNHEKERLRFIIAMLFYAGLRISELANLTWSSFRKTQNGWSLFVVGKGNKKRDIAIEDLLWDVMRYRQHLGLSLFPKPDEHTPVIRDLTGSKTITSAYMFKLIKRAAVTASKQFANEPITARRLKKFSPHWIRHLCPSLLVKAGVDARYIQDLLGHASSQTTNIYVHLFDEGRRSAVRHLKLWFNVD